MSGSVVGWGCWGVTAVSWSTSLVAWLRRFCIVPSRDDRLLPDMACHSGSEVERWKSIPARVAKGANGKASILAIEVMACSVIGGASVPKRVSCRASET